MLVRYILKRLVLLMAASGVCGHAFASAFQLWELDGVSVGDYHAGHAAIANDASTAFHNPAGLVNIKNQQAIAGASTILTNFKFNGTVAVNTLGTGAQPVTAQGGGFNLVPFGHYAAPIDDRIVFGLSVVVPFGLKTNYGDDTIISYAAMLSSIKVIDVAPALGIALTDKFSFGLGLDIQRMEGEFNQTATAFDQVLDTLSRNSGRDTAYGMHMGVLYQSSSNTRVGASYHSQVVHHLKGTSTFTGPLANDTTGGTQTSNNLSAKITLPPITSVSFMHSFNPIWDMMGSISYIQWSVIKNLVLKNTAGILGRAATNTLLIIIPQHYQNSWNCTVGANYHLNDHWLFRGGIGLDETPTRAEFRNLQLPDSNRIAVAFGGHYQANKNLGLDAGYTHVFAISTHINNISQTVGDEIVTTNGSVSASADVYAIQVKWDFA